MTTENFPNLDHQKRDELSSLCTELEIPQDMWLGERAILAIKKLQTKIKILDWELSSIKYHFPQIK